MLRERLGELTGVRGASMLAGNCADRASGLGLRSAVAPNDRVRRSIGIAARSGLEAVEPEKRVRLKYLGM